MTTRSSKPLPVESHVPAHPDPRDPAHDEWRVDEASDESFPASDPSATAMPHRSPRGDAPEESDKRALSHIERLVDEEHQLFGKEGRSDEDSARLKEIEVELDQCWDLLRQRRAARETGGDPAKAHVRPADIVERYTG
jgi:hypothetical protein